MEATSLKTTHSHSRIEILRQTVKQKPMKWVWQVLLALVLAHGWIWTGILKDKGVISDTQKLYALTILGIVLLAQQIEISRPKPKSRDAVERQRSIAENCLNSLLIDYRSKLNEKKYPVPEFFRANLALPTRSWFRWHMQIYYTACSDNTAYSADELNLKWRKGVGATGYAWKTKNITLYDSVSPKYQGPINTIKDEQLKTVNYLKSVIALPIVSRKGKVIGILVMDSNVNLSLTKFHQQWMIKLLQAYAGTMESVCFFDGVY